jgi:hypothetical protein
MTNIFFKEIKFELLAILVLVMSQMVYAQADIKVEDKKISTDAKLQPKIDARNKICLASSLLRKLTVNVVDKKILTSIIYSNISNQPMYVLKADPSIWIKLNDKNIRYIGPMIKRSPYTIEDYEKVESNKTTNRQFEISNKFDFKSGAHEYTVYLGGGYDDPLTKKFCEGVTVTSHFKYEKI